MSKVEMFAKKDMLNSDSNIIAMKTQRIVAVEEVPEFLEGQSSNESNSDSDVSVQSQSQSQTQNSSSSSSSMISDLSMMFAHDDDQSSSSNGHSTKSRITKPFKLKFLDAKSQLKVERETLGNFKLAV